MRIALTALQKMAQDGIKLAMLPLPVTPCDSLHLAAFDIAGKALVLRAARAA